ncbi:immunoglobulin E-set [Mycena sp. CBHHK59/15]|nr:immunoglobulin E-set [Mycena sp. CBHHK59/15]
MINIFALSSLVLATLHMAVAPASAHGYVSHPPSHQALCRDVPVPGCGDVKYEPQSVEALKGSFKCNGDGVRFHELNEERLWPHATATWEYFILTEHNTKLALFDDGGAVPPRTVVHQVPLHGYTGRQTILSRWNIADTPTAFYACVDLNINPTNTVMAVAGKAPTI